MEIRRRWVVPACLVVSSFVASGCEEDESGDEGASSPATDSATSESTSSSESGSGSDTTPTWTECYDAPSMEACLAETRFECRWDAEFENGCVPNCPAYTDEASCNDDIACAWTGDACEMAI